MIELSKIRKLNTNPEWSPLITAEVVDKVLDLLGERDPSGGLHTGAQLQGQAGALWGQGKEFI